MITDKKKITLHILEEQLTFEQQLPTAMKMKKVKYKSVYSCEVRHPRFLSA